VATFLKERSGCDAVGIRLQEGDDFPFAEVRGFPPEFVSAENSLCVRDADGHAVRDSSGEVLLACVCGAVIRRQFDPAKPYYTKRGSFWTNDASKLADREPELKEHIRGRCLREGYQSMAFIPLRQGNRNIGLLQFGSRRMDLFGPGAIELWERVADVLSSALVQAQAEQALRQNEARLSELIRLAPAFICVLRGPKHVFELANERYFELVGRRDILGKTLLEALPELAGQPYPQLLDQVLQTGEPFVGKEMRALLGPGPGALHEAWVDFVYLPLREPNGSMSGVFVHGVDITERKLHEQKLQEAHTLSERAKAAAEAADRAKDHFLAVLSHELRTPLTPVLATAAMLQQDSRFDADTHEQLEVIRRNAELEAMLIDDLLDVTRIARGKVELHKQPTELGEIIQHAVEVCMPDIKVRELEFGLDAKDGPYVVDADASRMQQVFWNLLKNSIKFTPVGGCVGIRCRRDGDGHVMVEVNDSGVGIDPEVLPRIFNAFEQGDRSTTRQFGGLGLGLAITKAMVEMHGGSIEARSAGKDKGATFSMRLPLMPAGSVAVSAALADKQRANEAKKTVHALRILLVEDHGDTVRIMRRLLEADGHQIETAADVATALKLAGEKTFDLLLSDLGLPDGSGLDLMRGLRARGLKLPGIAISGYG
jgi:two-component system CheB/CheR fusion protein